MADFAGKNVLVLGGSRGIGAAIVRWRQIRRPVAKSVQVHSGTPLPNKGEIFQETTLVAARGTTRYFGF